VEDAKAEPLFFESLIIHRLNERIILAAKTLPQNRAGQTPRNSLVSGAVLIQGIYSQFVPRPTDEEDASLSALIKKACELCKDRERLLKEFEAVQNRIA
jgi:hypothetical protein